MKANETKYTKPTPSKDVKKLAERIRALRIQAGYASHEVFAYEHNIPRAQYGRYERGENMRFDSLVKVIKALGLTVEEFFAEGFD